MRSIGEALRALMPAFVPREIERRSLLDARGAFLAEDVRAFFDAPALDQSAMDGYAVHAEDVATASESTPVSLPLVEESRAGGDAPRPLARGTACRVFTGARMPEGANAVVIQEDTTRDGPTVHVRFASPPNHHVRRRASDVASESTLVRAQTEIGAAEIALIASQGIATVPVRRRPRVAILSTGDELSELGEPLREGRIVNNNAWGLAAAVLDAGCVPVVLPIARDVLSDVRDRIESALASSDVVITTGGVSVGDHDVTRDAMTAAGVTLDFWKVAMKPGKPVAFGVARGRPVVGLPGNPVSALVTFDVLVRPGLRQMLGDPRPFAPVVRVELAAACSHSTGRLELARARFERRGDVLVAHLAARQGSASLSGFAGLDGYVLLDGTRASFAAGERVPAIALGRSLGVAESPLP